jgi:hypothetical protein
LYLFIDRPVFTSIGTVFTKIKIYMGWKARVEFLTMVRNLSLLHSVQNGSGANQNSYPEGVGSSFLGVKLTTHLAPRLRMLKLPVYSPSDIHSAVRRDNFVWFF